MNQMVIKMTKSFILLLTIVLLWCSLAKSLNVRKDDVKMNKDEEMNMSTIIPAMSMEEQNRINDVDMMAIMNECNETFHIEMSYLESLNASGSFLDETDKTPKCYIKCILEKSGVFDEEKGVFDPAKTASVFEGERGGRPMDDIEEMAATCTDRKESCKCERSYNYMKCLMEMEIKRYEMH
uniref:Odorant binding protein n=1 Tax=Eogystia hippophaecolus TaxID=1206364 RepID=A0A1B3P5I7_EOGHI|nr:odorant binding protein [Eogystia hippophaecolus]